MNSFSKFEGCDRILCIKTWGMFEVGKIYKCVVTSSEDSIRVTIEIDNNGCKNYLSCQNKHNSLILSKLVNTILETFYTIAEHRRLIIEDFL